MTRETGIQLACLYGPLAASALLAGWLRPGKQAAVGLLFSCAWVAALLPWLDSLARAAGLWEYRFHGPQLAGMPLALYLGWTIAWGVFAPLLATALGGRLWTTAVILVLLDLRLMPEMHPVLLLRPAWLAGEIAVVCLLLEPALFLAKWTAERTFTGWRCVLLAPAFGGIFLGIPLLVEIGGLPGIAARWLSLAPVARMLFLTAAGFLAIPGLAALRDLALSGGGTPVPLDPPRRLVTHGIYAFVRNPMQISMTSLLLLESIFIPSPWPAALALLGVCYSEGLARWSENVDLHERFGSAWMDYRKNVRPWWPRWQPRIGEPCELLLDLDCGSVARWFERHRPQRLELRAAADFPGPALSRVTWRHPQSGRCEPGVRGIAMALQHLSLPWALLGCAAGLPVISHALQIFFDAAGAGKRG